MYVKEQFDLPNPLADIPAIPPYYQLVALPTYVTASPEVRPFSIMEVIWEVFHSSQRVGTLFQPRIWAPGWNEMQLFSYLTDPLPKGFWPFVPTEPPALRAQSFLVPEEQFPEEALKDQCYDIVHFMGGVLSRRDQVWLDAVDKMWTPDEFAKRLVECKTRLFIFQSPEPESHEPVIAFTRSLVRLGVPAALAIAGEPDMLSDYCKRLYADISHNRRLSEVAEIPVWLDPKVQAHLSMRADCDDILRLDRWIPFLSKRLEYYVKNLDEGGRQWNGLQMELLKEGTRFLHPRQLDKLASMSEGENISFNEAVQDLQAQQLALQSLPSQPWHHESEGSLIISSATETLRQARPVVSRLLSAQMRLAQENLREELAQPSSSSERMIKVDWLDEWQQELQTAPRVLNAGFRPVGQTDTVNQTQTMVAGKDYELLVDIGPRWDKLQSLVTGQSEFPINALPPDNLGYAIDAVFLSEDFTPPLSAARMFLPTNCGRSVPWPEGSSAPTGDPGPLALKVRPRESPDTPTYVAHGRLGLYYDNNLLQSAQVRMTITRDRMGFAREPNAFEIDFVLSSGFQDVGERFAKRKVRFSEEDAWEETQGNGHPLALSITLNDDGGGNHRILLMSQSTPELNLQERSAWMSYDPAGNAKLLQLSRRDLADCFYRKDGPAGEVLQSARDNSTFALNPADNSQSKDQFLWDLVRLSERGAKLFNAVFSNLHVTDGAQTGAQQARLFQDALLPPRLIQVARTGPANYTFPWALLYEIPLSQDRSKNHFCEVLTEWADNGWRKQREDNKEHPPVCPHAKDPGHQTNTYCPFAFWGLKHIVEQPISSLRLGEGNGTKKLSLRDAPKKFGKPGAIPLGICLTSALKNLGPLDLHIQNIVETGKFAAKLPAARQLDDAKPELLDAALVYFLCHGKYDAKEAEPYLGIGPDDSSPQHRIYPTTIEGWARSQDWKIWDDQRPLVFINGCHTCDLEPGQVLQFVSAFGFAGASGVLGTEISVQLPLAMEVGKALLAWISQDVGVGEAFRRVRWDLVNKGNLLGLAYTPYCLADLARAVN